MNSRQTILIVDDVEMNRAILDATFSEDYRILEAENGKQAMELIMEQQDRLAAIPVSYTHLTLPTNSLV